jgi:alpha-tubulin suppressor-like RCC1 family protein
MNRFKHEPAGCVKSRDLGGSALLLAVAFAIATVASPVSAMRVGAGQFHSFLIKDDRSLWAWGDNFYGQIGDGTQVERSSPVKLRGLAAIVDVGGGATHSVAVRADGSVLAWAPTTGQRRRHHPDARAAEASDRRLATGSPGANHTVVVKSDGTAWAWERHQPARRRRRPSALSRYRWHVVVGNASSTPATITRLREERRLAVGWGWNDYSQIGDGSKTAR